MAFSFLFHFSLFNYLWTSEVGAFLRCIKFGDLQSFVALRAYKPACIEVALNLYW